MAVVVIGGKVERAGDEEEGGCGAGGSAPGREEEEGPEHDAADAANTCG